MLAVVMVLTCFPIYQNPAAYAAEGELEEKVVKLPDEEVKKNMEEAKARSEAEAGVPDLLEEDEQDEELAVLEAKDPEISLKKDDLLDEAKKKLSMKSLTLEDDSVITVSKQDSDGYVYVYSSIDMTGTSYYYVNLYIDDTDYPAVSLNTQSLNGFAVDLSDYSVGYHTIYVTANLGEGEQFYNDCVVYNVRSEILMKPSNSTSWYNTGTKSISAYYGGSYYYGGEYLDAYVQYKKGKNGKWSSKIYGPLNTYSTYKKIPKSLKPNTTYYVRMVLAKEVYNELTGKNELFESYSKAVKVMTAYKKPKVKKIDISNVKQKLHKYRWQWGWRIWYRNGIEVRRKALYHTRKWWTTKYKVTVKFKKKQKIAGIHVYTIQGMNWWLGGNKKSYHKTFTASGKKKGKKVYVGVKSLRSKKYGGWSGKYSKKVRCK